MSYNHIKKALESGLELNLFRNTTGLRFATLDVVKQRQNRYYGQGTNVEEALRILEDDVRLSNGGEGRLFKDVFNGVVETHYVTGEINPTSQLDKSLLEYHTRTLTFEDDQYHLRFTFKVDSKNWTPPHILRQCEQNIETIYWLHPQLDRMYRTKPVIGCDSITSITECLASERYEIITLHAYFQHFELALSHNAEHTFSNEVVILTENPEFVWDTLKQQLGK